MRNLLFIIICLKLSIATVFGQTPETPPQVDKPVIESVDISGVEERRITTELRERMQELVGQRFDQLAADEVAFEIQNAISERISAIRQFEGTQPGHIKVVFEFGVPRIDEDEHDRNVNSRYTVEDVELQGVSESLVSDETRRQMKDLVGSRMDDDRAENILRRLSRELRPSRVVTKRVVRGADRKYVRIIFDVERAPYLNFTKLGNYFVGHSKQSVSLGVEVPIQKRNNRFTFGIVNDGDQLIERFSGYRLSFENIKAGTEHLGFRIEFHSYKDQWKEATQIALAASPQVPGIYRKRTGVEPTLTFAFDPRLHISIGASVDEMQFQYPAIHYQNANAGIAAVTFETDWEDSGSNDHNLSANYLARAATRNLDSDFIYTRHYGELSYKFTTRNNQFVATAMAGAINGTAPLFERFLLGNTSTLRGWNKYDLAPIGGDRLTYGSLEYRYSVFQLFYDAGSVWDKGNSHETSHAVGFGLHSRDDDSQWFFTFGVPIRSGRIQPLKPVFMLGGRF